MGDNSVGCGLLDGHEIASGVVQAHVRDRLHSVLPRVCRAGRRDVSESKRRLEYSAFTCQLEQAKHASSAICDEPHETPAHEVQAKTSDDNEAES